MSPMDRDRILAGRAVIQIEILIAFVRRVILRHIAHIHPAEISDLQLALDALIAFKAALVRLVDLQLIEQIAGLRCNDST